MVERCKTHRGSLALLVLGALEEDERAACEAHLQRCARCRGEAARFRRTAQDLLLAAPAVDPPSALWARVQRRINEEARPPEFSVHPEAARAWIRTGEGVEICQLWVDRERERHTLLIRMQPGAWLPAHRHAGPEECLVVRGDLDDGRSYLRAGDYIRFEAGTRHAPTTHGGCTLFVTASLRDSAVSPA